MLSSVKATSFGTKVKGTSTLEEIIYDNQKLISGLCITLCLWKWKNYLNHCKLILLVTYSSYEFIFQVSSSQFSPLMNDRTLMKRPDVAFSLMRWPWTWSFVQTGQIGYKDISTLLLPYWRFVCELRLAKISKTKLNSVVQPFPMYRI